MSYKGKYSYVLGIVKHTPKRLFLPQNICSFMEFKILPIFYEKADYSFSFQNHTFLLKFSSCKTLSGFDVKCDACFLCSLRVNLDMGKAAYGWMIMKDDNIPGTVVRTSTIPEELGRLVYLLTDKTGT